MGKELTFEGIYPALVTPFDKKGNIDENAFKNLIDYIVPKVDGVVVCGTTGESVYLSLEERKRLYHLAVEIVNKRVPVIAGTGEASTCNTIELSKEAEKAGVDALLIVAPYFLHPSDKGIHKHYLEIAKRIDLPIILYNIPQAVGAYLPRRVIEDLVEIDNIKALKDSSGNLTYTMEVLEFVEDKIKLIIGHDEIVLPALAGGCSGIILASAQVFPEELREIFESVRNNNIKKAREVQKKIQKLTRIFCRYGGSVPVKSALNMMGIKVGTARKPLRVGGVLSHEDREEIRIELIKLGKIKPAEALSTKEEDVKNKKLEEKFEDIGINKEIISELKEKVYIGEYEAGEGNEKVLISLIAGYKDSPIGESYAYQMTHPRHGYEALTAILEPNLTVRPATLLIPAIEQKTLRQANMIFGPAQVASSKAIVQCVQEDIIPSEKIDDIVMLIKIFIHPLALDRKKIYKNTYLAVLNSIKQAFGS